MKKKYIVDLSAAEREELEKMATTGRRAAYKITHARILLKTDQNIEGGGWGDREVAKALNVGTATVERVRHRFVELGLEAAVGRKAVAGRERRLSGELEAHLIALACSETPSGQGHWTMRLLAQKMVELEYVESLSHETVRKTLKKMNFNPGNRNAG